MVAFNTNFVFLNEAIRSTTINPTLPTVHVEEKLNLASKHLYPMKSPWLNMSGKQVRYCSHTYFNRLRNTDNWGLEIKDTLYLSWDRQRQIIYYQKGILHTSALLQFWILHTFFPLVLELQRKYKILHVGAVEINHKAILFSAQSYGGKSTLTNYFLQQNHALLSDDSLAIEEKLDRYYAIPSYPFHRPYRELETLGDPVDNFAQSPKPIHAIYVLEKSLPSSNIQISPLSGIEKYKALHYSNYIDFDFMKKEQFIFFTNISKHLPMYKITIPWELSRLHTVYTAIIQHTSL